MTPLKKYIWLVGTLMRSGEKGLTMEQIGDRWDADDEMHDNGAFARRSFHRHRKEIEELFGIEIESYGNGREFRYRIADSGKNGYFRQWMLNSIAVNQIVTDSHEVAQYIAIEKSHTDPLPDILQAMKEMRMMEFDYGAYWRDRVKRYADFRPHALKMFERRWYVVGKYAADMPYRIFALDRISNLEIQKETYTRDPDFDVEELFKDSYGIILGDDLEVESVWIKVDAFQANYLRSLPLHRSQIELRRNEEYSLFAVRVRPTLDFRQRLLSLGSTVEVLKPESLRAEMKEEIAAMLSRYKEEEE
jgi:hypothetical protein